MERQRVMFPWDLISLAAVFLDVTQRSPKRALRDDGNDNKNGKKRNRFRLAEQQLCMYITPFLSLRCTTATLIFLISRALFVEVGENTTKFLFLNLDIVLSDSTPENFPNI